MRKLVLIEWIDSIQPVAEWKYINDAPSLESANCLSIGWLIKSNKEVIMIAPNICDIESDHSQASGFIRIPTCSIIKKVDIKIKLPSVKIK